MQQKQIAAMALIISSLTLLLVEQATSLRDKQFSETTYNVIGIVQKIRFNTSKTYRGF